MEMPETTFVKIVSCPCSHTTESHVADCELLENKINEVIKDVLKQHEADYIEVANIKKFDKDTVMIIFDLEKRE